MSARAEGQGNNPACQRRAAVNPVSYHSWPGNYRIRIKLFYYTILKDDMVLLGTITLNFRAFYMGLLKSVVVSFRLHYHRKIN